MSSLTNLFSKTGIPQVKGFIDSRVSLKILIASILGFIAVIAALVWLNIISQEDLLLQQEKAVLETQIQILKGQIKNSEKLALALATVTSSRSDVQDIFADRDREALAALTVPGFNSLLPIIGTATKSQFHIPPAKSFLRLDNLELYGDDLSGFRPAVNRVNFEKVPTSGIEIGRYSAAIRGIVPISSEDDHMGSVEFGTGLSSEFLAGISTEYHINSAIYFYTKASELNAFFQAMEKKDRIRIKKQDFMEFATSWGKGKIKTPADIYSQRVNAVKKGTKDIYYHYDNPGKQTIAITVLHDYNNSSIGTLEVHLDRTLVLAQIAQSQYIALAAGLSLALVGSLLIWFLVNKTVGKPVREITNVYHEIGMGNFAARTTTKTTDELGTMASSLNAMLDNTLVLIQSQEQRDAVQKSIMKLLDEVSALTDGDLTARAEVTEDVTGAIADSFNAMAEQLSHVVRDVKKATIKVGTTSKDISLSTEKLSNTSETQAVQITNAISTINKMSAAIKQMAEFAIKSTSISEQSMIHAKDGAQAVQDTNRAMEAIRDNVQETARTIKRLGESSQEIGNIVQLINDIADRTSILALNASIQAAMAGEAGRGFAVVAEEVQRLAERSTSSTKQIDALVKNIQGEINEAGTSMEESIQRVVQGSRLADGAHNKLQEIEKDSMDLARQIQSITHAANAQAKVSTEISHTMERVGKTTTQTASASKQTALSMKSMAETADQLRESVEVFKLGDDISDSDKNAQDRKVA